MLNLDQTRIFLSVARHLHFSRAAEELFISQPAVSATIAKLEHQAGVQLFHRIGRRVELTDAGRFLQQEGHNLVEQSKRLERGLQDFNNLERGCLQLGASFTVGNYWLPRYISQFRSRYPAIELHCKLANANAILDGTNRGHFDLGFICGRQPDGLATVVGEESLQLVVGQNHPWFGVAWINAAQLDQAAWLMREPGSGAQQMLEQWLQEIGLQPSHLQVQQVLHSSEMMKAMVCDGTGLAALPSSLVKQEVKLGLLWPLELQDQRLKAEPIWMLKSPCRQDSPLLACFEGLTLSADGRCAGAAAKPALQRSEAPR